MTFISTKYVFMWQLQDQRLKQKIILFNLFMLKENHQTLIWVLIIKILSEASQNWKNSYTTLLFITY